MKELRIKVEDKVATLVNDVELVCGNSDYKVIFEFDEDWAKYNAKTALFVYGNKTVEVPFTGDVIDEDKAVAIEKATKCYIGVYTGDLITTTKAEVKCKQSIRDIATTPTAPTPDVYDRIIELINELKLEGSAIINVETLPENPEDIEEGWLYQTAEGIYWYDGSWHKVIDESEIALIENRIAQVENIAKGAGQAVSYGNYSTMIDALNVMPRGRYRVGQSVMIVTVNVPDLWVSAIGEESTEYTYTSDEDFVSALKSNGSVKVGHYQLSQLETQKVDLTEYVKNTDIAQNRGQAGLIRWSNQHGWMMTPDGFLYLQRFGRTQIDERKTYSWLDCSNVDDIVQSALTNSQITWSEDTKDESGAVVKGDKTKARELLGAVGATDYATATKGGVVKMKRDWGYTCASDGSFYVLDASMTNMPNRHKSDHVFKQQLIKYGQLDIAVKAALIDNYETLTAEEKTAALKWLGALVDTDVVYTCDEYNHQALVEGYYFDKYGYAASIEMSQEIRKDYEIDVECEDGYGNISKGTVSLADARVITLDGGYALSIDTSSIYYGCPEARVIVVTDTEAFNKKCNCDLESTGTYLSFTQWDNDAMGITLTTKVTALRSNQPKVRQDALYLEGHPYIKALISRIEALENK